MQLIDEWRRAHRLWSVRLNALGSALLSLFLAWPDAALGLWNMMPVEVKALLPERAVMLIPLIFFLAALGARFVRQDKLHGDN